MHACRDEVTRSCSQTPLYQMHDGLNRTKQAKSRQHCNSTRAQQHVVVPEATEMALTWRMATCKLLYILFRMLICLLPDPAPALAI